MKPRIPLRETTEACVWGNLGGVKPLGQCIPSQIVRRGLFSKRHRERELEQRLWSAYVNHSSIVSVNRSKDVGPKPKW